jgi:Uma2 family endonuclease
MNIVVAQPVDELPLRRTFSADDVRRVVEAGVLAEGENIELIDGVLVTAAANGYGHEFIRQTLLELFITAKPKHIMVAAGPSLQLSDKVIVEPDVVVFPRYALVKSEANFMHVAPGDVLLAVESAASGMRYDKVLKAGLYARFGVQEYWVIDANERITWVHKGPTENGWRSIVECGPDDALTPAALPDIAVRLAEVS